MPHGHSNKREIEAANKKWAAEQAKLIQRCSLCNYPLIEVNIGGHLVPACPNPDCTNGVPEVRVVVGKEMAVPPGNR